MIRIRIHTYRHSIGDGSCSDPYHIIQVHHTAMTPNHICHKCGQMMIPMAYYAIHEDGNPSLKYFIHDIEITKDEFDLYEDADRKINQRLQTLEYLDIQRELKQSESTESKKGD